MYNAYNFYELDEVNRKNMIGTEFKEDNRENIYFPVQLAEGEWNYGMPQGLIFVTPILNYQGRAWFRVGVFSPDDLDMDLDFTVNVQIRSEVLEFIRKANKWNVSYRGFLEQIQQHFNAGSFD